MGYLLPQELTDGDILLAELEHPRSQVVPTVREESLLYIKQRLVLLKAAGAWQQVASSNYTAAAAEPCLLFVSLEVGCLTQPAVSSIQHYGSEMERFDPVKKTLLIMHSLCRPTQKWVFV